MRFGVCVAVVASVVLVSPPSLAFQNSPLSSFRTTSCTTTILQQAYYDEDDDNYNEQQNDRHQDRFKNVRRSSYVGHDYERDTSRDDSPVDVSAIDMLLSERVEAKKRRDFDTADAIRDRLEQEFSVGVFDKDKVWKTGYQARRTTGGRFDDAPRGGPRGRFGGDRGEGRFGGDRGGGRFGDRNGGGRFGDRNGGRFEERGGRFNDRGGGSRFEERGGRFNDRGGGSRFEERGGRFNDRGGGRFEERGRFGGGQRSRGPPPPRDFGPNGHDYSLSPDAGPIESSLTEPEIHALLAERLQAKMSRRFRDADRIQKELFTCGVIVHDGKKEWRADGQAIASYVDGKPARQAYTQAPHSDECPEDDIPEIERLVASRGQAKSSRVFEVADRIRDELIREYNVHVNDRLRQWSVGDKFGRDNSLILEYQMSPLSEITDDAKYIQAQVDLRAAAKMSRDYATADAIREELLGSYGVVINDRVGEWSVGGEFAGEANKRDKMAYVRVGGGNISAEDEALVVEKLEERSQAKKQRDYGRADDIRDELMDQFAVKINDKAREWLVVSDSYSFVGDRSALDDETFEYIENRVKERLGHKNTRNYAAADEIRDELETKYSVAIEDRSFEWSISKDRAPRAPKGWGFEAPEVESVPYRFKDDSPLKKEAEGIDEDASDDSTIEDSMNDFTVDDLTVDDFTVEDSPDSAFEVEEDEPVSATLTPVDDDGKKESNGRHQLSEEELSQLTVPKLKERLKEVGLPVSGRKAELIERLLDS